MLPMVTLIVDFEQPKRLKKYVHCKEILETYDI